MKLQKILNRIKQLHPKEIDLNLSRILKLSNKLGNPQDELNCISVVGTNGKYSTIQTIKSILEESNQNYNSYTSPHMRRINERFVYNNKEITDDDLAELLTEVEYKNNGDPITLFEILTASFFYGAKKYKENLTIVETGLFHRFDATNILKQNLLTIVTAIGLDHLDWLPKNDRNINRVIFEKTSSLLNSKIIICNQDKKETLNKIKKSIKKNKSEKIIFGEKYKHSIGKNDFFYYEDDKGSLKLPYPNLIGEFQLSNVSGGICALRNIDFLNIRDSHIKNAVTKIKSVGRLQEIKKGKLKKLSKKNKIFIDGSHNPLGAKVLSNHLKKLKCNKHMILGMMDNKDHKKYINYFKGKINSLITINIPNQKNSVDRNKLKNKIKNLGIVVSSKPSVQEAIKSIPLKENDTIIITGSLYLAAEILKQN